MSIAEMKKAISEKVNKLTEGQLKEVDLFINKINTTSQNEWDLTHHINSIVKEREEVLKKLAQ